MTQVILAITKADFLLRFRRTSTAVVFLLLILMAYLSIPDLATGRTLILIGDARVIYNSAAISLATALLGSALLSFVGFYLVSNSIRRDVTSRVGFIIAATPVSNAAYIIGKFLGNVLFLAAIATGFMFSSMVMQVLRGEAAVEPLVFLSVYAAMFLPVVFFVSALALMFETISFLSGRAGDIIYFFVWSILLSIPAVDMSQQGSPPSFIGQYFDVIGMGAFIRELTNIFGTSNLNIGQSSFKADVPPVLLKEFPVSWILVRSRLSALLLALPFIGIAALRFHRFDPIHIKARSLQMRGNILNRINGLLKPLSGRLIPPFHGSSSFLRLVTNDVILTLKLSPITVLLIVGLNTAAATMSLEVVQSVLLPIICFSLVVLLAEISTREKAAGVLRLLFSTPSVKRYFVWWKFFVAVFLTLLITLIPMIRLSAVQPQVALSLLIGSVFTASLAVTLGIWTETPKTFAMVFLFFLYIVMNDKTVPSFDFAGWYGIATPSIQAGYAAAAALLLFLAEAKHRWQLMRQF